MQATLAFYRFGGTSVADLSTTAAFAAPTAVMAGSEAHPLPAQQRYECDCGFLGERVERFLDYLDEMFALHPSPTEVNRGTLTLSSRRLLFLAVAFVVLIVVILV